MSDVTIGSDGRPRCSWAGAGDTAFGRYHDDVWGTRTSEESAMFEALTLGVFEVGLSWSVVFGKTRRVPVGVPRFRRRGSRDDDRARRRPARRGPSSTYRRRRHGRVPPRDRLPLLL